MGESVRESAPRAIRELAEDVVHRIAAGEVIQRASSAFKEILENSLDAGATEIEGALLNHGGFQLRDNGCGIRPEDLPILCRRHTTSKLASYGDLKELGTLGFRGEALCSVSYVAHVTVTTRIATSPVGLRALYADGELQRDPTPCSALIGTTVCVKDIFAHDPVRRAAATTPEEIARVTEIVKYYAIDALGVGFSLRRETKRAPDFAVQESDAQLDRISKLFGWATARSLVSLGDASMPRLPDFKIRGWVGALAGGQKRVFALFINGRCVEWPALKRAIYAVYASLLPKQEPFVYLSLHLPPSQLDVNIHPTKREVAILCKDDVIHSITAILQQRLIHAADHRIIACKRSSSLYPLKCAAAKLNVDEAVHTESRRLIEGHSYVGMTEGRYVFVHFESKLYMLDIQKLSDEFFFQHIQNSVGRIEKYELPQPLAIRELLKTANEAESVQPQQSSGEDVWIADRCSLLLAHADVTRDLFSVQITREGLLMSLPHVLESYPPFTERLPLWLLHLSECLQTWNNASSDLTPLVSVMSELFTIQSPSEENAATRVEHVLMPAMRELYIPSPDRVLDHSIVQLASIQQLCSRCQR